MMFLYQAKNVLAITTVLMVGVVGCGSASKSPTVLSSTSFKLHPYQEVTLKNGLKVLLIPDDKLPSYSIELLVKSGSTVDPKDLPGVAALTASLLELGTTHKSASQIADDFGLSGTQFGVQVEKDFTLVTASGLSQYQDSLTKDFLEIVTEPTFSEPELARIRSRALSSVRELVDEPERFSSSVFEEYLYGNHPYGPPTQGTLSSLKRIRRKDIIKFYLSNYRPNNCILAVIGKFKPGIEAQIETLLKDWTPKEVKPVALEPFPLIQGVQFRLITKSDLKQADVFFGQAGIERKDPEFLTLRVANTILGTGFSSRLLAEIRIKRALTYHISSVFDARLGQGPFIIESSTRLDKIHEMVTETLNTLKVFHDKGVSEEEVSTAKNFLKGMFPRALETPEKVAENLLILKFYGISDDYLKSYFRNLDAISVEQVNEVIAKHFDAGNMRVQIYAPKAMGESQLKPIGPLEVKSFQDFL